MIDIIHNIVDIILNRDLNNDYLAKKSLSVNI